MSSLTDRYLGPQPSPCAALTPIRLREQMLPRVAEVIISSQQRGDGKNTVLRRVIQVHTLDGEFIAEHDPHPDQPEGT
ncbi:MAG: hypothetical protein PSY14_06825 [bacterium]|nr:hypothetical protein [bacterium]